MINVINNPSDAQQAIALAEKFITVHKEDPAAVSYENANQLYRVLNDAANVGCLGKGGRIVFAYEHSGNSFSGKRETLDLAEKVIQAAAALKNEFEIVSTQSRLISFAGIGGALVLANRFVTSLMTTVADTIVQDAPTSLLGNTSQYGTTFFETLSKIGETITTTGGIVTPTTFLATVSLIGLAVIAKNMMSAAKDETKKAL